MKEVLRRRLTYRSANSINFLFRATAPSAHMETITEAKPTRVMGIGVGLFLLIFLGAIALLMCLVGSATARPG